MRITRISSSRRKFLEGRWAQLTVDAHIAGAIDYSRPVKPFIEQLILDRMEVFRNISRAQIYPVFDDDQGSQCFMTKAWTENHVEDELFPWKTSENMVNYLPSSNIKERIEQLKEVQRKR